MKTTTEMQLVPISKLVPYVNNARTHSPEQITKLRSSLREFGFINPVIIDRDYGVIAGHGRIMAAKEEGIKEVPCVFADHLTEAQKKAYIIADNRMAVDARVPERTLREIYLRGFEIAVKAAAPAAVMSAYNCINGVHAANSRDLCTVVLRQEWGFAGLVMSDWNTTVPQDGSTPWRCAWAGNDVIMPGNPHDAQDIRAALADGRLPETAIRQSAARLIALATALRGGFPYQHER